MNRAITVLVVTYQSENDLDRCLGSLALAAPNSRLIVKAWDNASTDRSLSRLHRAGVAVTASRENIGFAAAVNRLAASVDTPFLFLLNPDAAATPGAIDVLVDAALAMPERDMFCGRTIFPDGSTNPTCAWGPITPFSAFLMASGLSMLWPGSSRLSPESLPDWDRMSDRAVDIATGCALLVRTATWRSLGGFDERYWLYCEEADLQLRLVRSGRPRPWFVSAATFVHDNGATISPDLPLKARVARSTAVLKGRATFMRHAWSRATRWMAGPILWLTALRHGVQALAGGAEADRHRALWQNRADWIAGYP